MEQVTNTILLIAASFFAGWYFFSHVYGVNKVLNNTIGFPNDNPVTNGLNFVFRQQIESRWITYPAFALHLLLLPTALFVFIGGLLLSIQDNSYLLVMGVPICLGSALRYWQYRIDMNRIETNK